MDDLKLLVLALGDERWARLRELVLREVNDSMGSDDDRHGLWLELTKAMINATDHPAPSIQDWMVARERARLTESRRVNRAYDEQAALYAKEYRAPDGQVTLAPGAYGTTLHEALEKFGEMRGRKIGDPEPQMDRTMPGRLSVGQCAEGTRYVVLWRADDSPEMLRGVWQLVSREEAGAAIWNYGAEPMRVESARLVAIFPADLASPLTYGVPIPKIKKG